MGKRSSAGESIHIARDGVNEEWDFLLLIGPIEKVEVRKSWIISISFGFRPCELRENGRDRESRSPGYSTIFFADFLPSLSSIHHTSIRNHPWNG